MIQRVSRWGISDTVVDPCDHAPGSLLVSTRFSLPGRGLNGSGRDSHVFLPMNTEWFIVVSLKWWRSSGRYQGMS